MRAGLLDWGDESVSGSMRSASWGWAIREVEEERVDAKDEEWDLVSDAASDAWSGLQTLTHATQCIP